jgi:hypothetical protein
MPEDPRSAPRPRLASQIPSVSTPLLFTLSNLMALEWDQHADLLVDVIGTLHCYNLPS